MLPSLDVASTVRAAMRYALPFFFARSLSETPAKTVPRRSFLTNARNKTGGARLHTAPLKLYPCKKAARSNQALSGGGPFGAPRRRVSWRCHGYSIRPQAAKVTRTTILALGGLLALCAGNRAYAHDQWANGDPVPAWVKRACCGPHDIHHLTRERQHQGLFVTAGTPGYTQTRSETEKKRVRLATGRVRMAV
jgi:hypothetical protein